MTRRKNFTRLRELREFAAAACAYAPSGLQNRLHFQREPVLHQRGACAGVSCGARPARDLHRVAPQSLSSASLSMPTGSCGRDRAPPSTGAAGTTSLCARRRGTRLLATPTGISSSTRGGITITLLGRKTQLGKEAAPRCACHSSRRRRRFQRSLSAALADRR